MKLKKSPVIVLDRALVTSDAYLSLGGVAPQVLMLFYCRRRLEKLGRKGKQRWVCVNANEIEFTYLEARKKFGITNSRFTRAIDDLITKGFIEIVHHGGCYQKDKTQYGLSERWRSFNTPEFSAMSRPKDPVKRGYRKPKSGALSKAKSTLEKGAIEHANSLLSRVQFQSCNVAERSHDSGMESEFKLHKNRQLAR